LGDNVPFAAPFTAGSRRAAASVPGEVERAKSKRSFQRLARLGLASRAAIYFLLAFLAGDIALRGSAPANASSEGALAEVGHQPVGRPLLAVLAVGLAGYALWRAADALTSGPDERRSRSWPKRAGLGAVAVVYAFLSYQAVRLAVSPSSSGGGNGVSAHPQPFVASVLRWPGGPLWAGALGAALAMGGLSLAVWGCLHDYRNELDRSRIGPGTERAVGLTGAVGEVTRGLLVALVSAFLLAAGVTDNPRRAKSLDQALRSFGHRAGGPEVLALAALGLACFAVFSGLEALYRRF